VETWIFILKMFNQKLLLTSYLVTIATDFHHTLAKCELLKKTTVADQNSLFPLVDPAKQDGVVYRIPYECGKVYINCRNRKIHAGEVKEHDRDRRLARTQTSAVSTSEQANKTGHHPLWNEEKFIDRDSHWYAQWDNGYEIPEAWIPTIK